MTVTTLMPVRTVNLVVPLPHEGTAMRTAETAATVQARPGAVAPLTGESLRPGDVDCTNHPSTRSATRGSITSTTATRTTTTRATRPALAPSADSQPCSFEQLVAAYLDCRRHKRNSTSALAFEANLEHNLCDLFNELQGGSYRPGRSICCVITRPKPREVWAADFRDRIVHHLIYAHIGLRFEAAFVAKSCACIKGRGTLYAAERLEHAIRSVTHNWSRPAWYLKCDLANFFVAIDKHVLRAQLAARVLDLAVAAMTWLNRQRWVTIDKNTWELELLGKVNTNTEQTVRSFHLDLIVRGFDIDEGHAFDLTARLQKTPTVAIAEREP